MKITTFSTIASFIFVLWRQKIVFLPNLIKECKVAAVNPCVVSLVQNRICRVQRIYEGMCDIARYLLWIIIGIIEMKLTIVRGKFLTFLQAVFIQFREKKFFLTYSQSRPSFINVFVQYSQKDLPPLRTFCGEAPRAEIRTPSPVFHFLSLVFFLFLVSCFLSLMSYILSLVSYLLTFISYLVSFISYLLSLVPYLFYRISYVLSLVSWSYLLSFIFHLLPPIFCLPSNVSRHLKPVSF